MLAYRVEVEEGFRDRLRTLDNGELRDVRATARWLAANPEIAETAIWSYQDGQRRWWRAYEAAELGVILFFRIRGNVIVVGDVWLRRSPAKLD